MPRTLPFERRWKACALALALVLLAWAPALAGSRTAGPEEAGLDVAVVKSSAGPLHGKSQAVDLWIAFKNNEKALFLQELEAVEVEITGFWNETRRSEPLVRRIELRYRPELHPGASSEIATRIFVDHAREGFAYDKVKVRVLHYWGRWSL